jgi:hypothetical protein
MTFKGQASRFQSFNVSMLTQRDRFQGFRVSRLPGELGVLSGLMSDKKEIARQGERSKLGNFETLKL